MTEFRRHVHKAQPVVQPQPVATATFSRSRLPDGTRLSLLENPVRDPAAEAIRAQRTVLEVKPVLVFIVDRADREAMEMNIQPPSRRDQKVAAVPVTKGKVELAIANHEFPIRFPTAETPPVSGSGVVVIFVHVVSLIEAEKAYLPFHSKMPPQVEIQEPADAIQMVRP